MNKRTLSLAAAGLALLSFAPVAHATAPTADVSPSSGGFSGMPSLGTVSGSQVFQVKNNGDDPLIVSGETFGTATGFDGSDDFFVGSTNCGGSIGSGSSCEIKVRFAPSVAGPRGATMHIEWNGGTTDVGLTGTGGDVATGPTGPTGPIGPAGPRGLTGLTGPIGTQGPPGRDAQIRCKAINPKKGSTQHRVICTVKFVNASVAAASARSR